MQNGKECMCENRLELMIINKTLPTIEPYLQYRSPPYQEGGLIFVMLGFESREVVNGKKGREKRRVFDV